MPEPLTIKLDDLPSNRELVYIGDRVRPSTATSIVLLNPNTFACCHFNGCKLFLFRFDLDNGTYAVLDSCDTTFGGQKTETDLMTSDGHGNLVTTNFFHHTCTFYRHENAKLHFVSDCNYKIGHFVHGIKYYSKDVVAITSRGKSGGVHFIDRNTEKLIFLIKVPGFSIQDIAFLSRNRLAMITGHGTPKIHPEAIYSSFVHIIDFDMKNGSVSILNGKVFEASHFDNMVCYNNRLYFTDQYNNRVLCLDPGTLETHDEYGDYNFPHGIDVNYGIRAVTNYGSNTIDLRYLT